MSLTVEAKGGDSLLEGHRSRSSRSRLSGKHRWGRVAHWNLAGQPLTTLDVALPDSELVFVQEVERGGEGWDSKDSDIFHWITHRAPGQWSSVGVGIALDRFDSVVHKVATDHGIWLLVRIKGLGRVACGSLHALTGVTNVKYQSAIHQFFRALPRKWRQYPLLCGVDANEVPNWVDSDVGLSLGHCSTNLNVLVQEEVEHDCHACAPLPAQRFQPTHFPRDETRQGRQIDMVFSRHVTVGPVQIDPDRRHVIGTDHALLQCEVTVGRPCNFGIWGNDSRARWVNCELRDDILVDEDDIIRLGKLCTRPRKSSAYADDDEIKAAIQEAKHCKDKKKWKQVHRLRKQARKRWHEDRLSRILSGGWDEFRQLQSEKKRHRGWWGELLQDRSSNDLSSEVRQHLESKMVDVTRHDWDERLQAIIETVPESELQPFSLLEIRAELQQMRCRSAVGPDGIGVHLLREIASHDSLGPQLRDLVNHIVGTLELPHSWEKSFLALLAKCKQPKAPGDLRPISVSSASNKLVNRLVCSRTLPVLRRGSRVSACGAGRQAADLIGCATRIRDVVHEWKLPCLLCKLDVAGAFDRVDRYKVADLLCSRLLGRGLCCELRYLLSQLRVHTLQGQVPGGDLIEICPNNGIKQGAPESAEIFGLVVEVLLAELAESRQWKAMGRPYQELEFDFMFYQDDVFLVDDKLPVLGKRIRAIDKCLQQAGLRLATNKTKVVASDAYRGCRRIKIGSDLFNVAPQGESLKVLGLSFSFGHPMSRPRSSSLVLVLLLLLTEM